MDVKPVKKYDGPDYPAKWVLDQHPELPRLIPKRWQNNPASLATLGALILLMAGCRNASAADQSSTARVAPIFQHGDGRGAFGCKVINPPVFLSEDEGRQIVIDEAKRAGIRFTEDVKAVSNVRLPVTDMFNHRYDKSGNPLPPSVTKVGTLKLDGTDTKRNLSFEFVSERDFKDMESDDHMIWSSVQSYDLQGLAKGVRNGLARIKPDGHIGVFYDPVRLDTSRSGSKKINALTSEKSAEETLRQQVRDFIKWLKAEGVI